MLKMQFVFFELEDEQVGVAAEKSGGRRGDERRCEGSEE